MSRISRSGAALLAAVLAAAPLMARAADATPDTSAPQGQGGTTPQASVPSPAGTLGIATVTLKNGWRASKLIGAAVYNEQNQKIGTVDDLILTGSDKVVVAVISVGGFLGIGGKLVAVPFDKLQMANGKATLAGATKDALNGMPSFTYGNT
jgi:sporulation protein YlmC with PRC-barrel domain